MKALLFVALFALAAARTVEDDIAVFADFKLTYGRSYSPSEEAHRFRCFTQTLDTVERQNANTRDGATYAINQFADLCADEFQVYHSLQVSNKTTYNYDAIPNVRAGSVDWRTKGAVTHVKNQGMCGSCWSFSATGNMEGQWKLAGNTLVGLSEQELVSCSHNGNQGCNGGLMDSAFEWVIQNGGIDTESDYAYTSGGGNSGTCNQAKVAKKVAKFSSHVDVTKSEDAMATWVAANGPLSIAVDAAQGWQTYHGGIMSDCTGRQLDHGVMIVGYDDSGSSPYWIVKNSWGAGWGENGYIRLAKGSDQCGLTQMPSSIKA